MVLRAGFEFAGLVTQASRDQRLSSLGKARKAAMLNRATPPERLWSRLKGVFYLLSALAERFS